MKDWIAISIHVTQETRDRLRELAHRLTISHPRHLRVTQGEVLERALAALDRELGQVVPAAIQEAAKPAAPRPPKPTLAEIDAEIAKRAAATEADAESGVTP